MVFSVKVSAGSVITGTHGSGINNKIIASYALKMSMVLSNGDVLHLNKDFNKDFNSYLINMGALGVVYSMTFSTVKNSPIKEFYEIEY